MPHCKITAVHHLIWLIDIFFPFSIPLQVSYCSFMVRVYASMFYMVGSTIQCCESETVHSEALLKRKNEQKWTVESFCLDHVQFPKSESSHYLSTKPAALCRMNMLLISFVHVFTGFFFCIIVLIRTVEEVLYSFFFISQKISPSTSASLHLSFHLSCSIST